MSYFGMTIDGDPFVFPISLDSSAVIVNGVSTGSANARGLVVNNAFVVDDAPDAIAIFMPVNANSTESDGSIRIYYYNDDGTYGESFARPK
jgi:hypothetical protein